MVKSQLSHPFMTVASGPLTFLSLGYTSIWTLGGLPSHGSPWPFPLFPSLPAFPFWLLSPQCLLAWPCHMLNSLCSPLFFWLACLENLRPCSKPAASSPHVWGCWELQENIPQLSRVVSPKLITFPLTSFLHSQEFLCNFPSYFSLYCQSLIHPAPQILVYSAYLISYSLFRLSMVPHSLENKTQTP